MHDYTFCGCLRSAKVVLMLVFILLSYSKLCEAKQPANTLAGTATNVLNLGAQANGTNPNATTRAFKAAIEKGGLIIVPAGTYALNDTLVLKHNSYLRGVGQGTNPKSKVRSILKFVGLGERPAIATRQSSDETGLTCGLEGLYIYAAAWVGIEACTGHGLDLEAPVTVRNCYVGNFKRSNVFLHNDTKGNGPYESLFENLYSALSGQHGCVVGTGANVVTFLNCRFFWNGSPRYGVKPTAGDYDGLIVMRDGDGNPGRFYNSHLPEVISIIGGDASYNARYGWNFSQLRNSFLTPGYAEGNLGPAQVRIGRDVRYTQIIFSAVAGMERGIRLENTYTAYNRENAVYLGGKYLGGGHPAAAGEAYRAHLLNMLDVWLAEDKKGRRSFRAYPTQDPDGDFTGEYNFTVSGPGASLSFNHGAQRKLVIGERVSIPGHYDHAGRARSVGTEPPSSTGQLGDIVYHARPTPGGYVGWIYTTSGWKGFGTIAP